MVANYNRIGERSRYKNRIMNNILFAVLIILIIIAAIILAIKPTFKNWIITSIPEDSTTLEGIDISNHQGNIIWEDIDQNLVNFVFIKATEGTTFTDKSFSKNWEASKEAGFLRGAYHYFTITSDGKKQAEHFINIVPKEKITLPPVIDIEEVGDNQAKLIVEIREYANIIEKHYGVKPIFYVNKKTYELYIRDNFKDHIIWYAVYGSEPPIDTWTIWQYTDNGTSNGIKGPVDFNIFKGNKKDIMKLTN